MRNRKILTCIIVAVFLILNGNMTLAKEKNVKGIILIDPGHGGIDGGAISSSGTIEKDINLKISKKLKNVLSKEGYKVYLTRNEDTELNTKKSQDLESRCKMKEETKCDIFISIHQNKFSNSSCFGAQVWYADNEKSSLIAEKIQESIKESVNDNNKRLAKPAKNLYKILRDGYDGASVIVECGFLSNYNEEQLLKSEKHQDKIVEGIKNGVNKYFEK